MPSFVISVQFTKPYFFLKCKSWLFNRMLTPDTDDWTKGWHPVQVEPVRFSLPRMCNRDAALDSLAVGMVVTIMCNFLILAMCTIEEQKKLVNGERRINKTDVRKKQRWEKEKGSPVWVFYAVPVPGVIFSDFSQYHHCKILQDSPASWCIIVPSPPVPPQLFYSYLSSKDFYQMQPIESMRTMIFLFCTLLHHQCLE